MKLHEAPDDKLVAAYIKIRDEIASDEAAAKAAIAPKKEKLDKIESEFLRRFAERGSEAVRTNSGTAYKSVRRSVSVGDWEAFFIDWVIPNQAWEFINHAPNKSSVIEYRDLNGDIPPGLNLREEYVVGLRRA